MTLSVFPLKPNMLSEEVLLCLQPKYFLFIVIEE